MMGIIILSPEDRGLIVGLLRQALGTTYKRLAELLEEAPDKHTIRIVIRNNTVEDVEKLPMGFNYEVQDLDKCSECGGLEPFCGWCLYGMEDPDGL